MSGGARSVLRDWLDPAVAAALETALGPGALVATDADGTLWSDDLSDTFLQRLEADRVLVADDSRENAWRSYEARRERDLVSAIGWQAQAMAGMREADVVRHARAHARGFLARNARPALRVLLAEALTRGCDVRVVSGTNRWAVAAAAELLGVAAERVVGTQVAVRDGRLTAEIVPPIPYAAGKVVAIRAAAGRLPDVAIGDTAGDLDLLESARLALVIEHGQTAPAVLARARERGWLVQRQTP